jgi:hypothetical protein
MQVLSEVKETPTWEMSTGMGFEIQADDKKQ